jgi:hypothetical protein
VQRHNSSVFKDTAAMNRVIAGSLNRLTKLASLLFNGTASIGSSICFAYIRQTPTNISSLVHLICCQDKSEHTRDLRFPTPWPTLSQSSYSFPQDGIM